jgi:hypothetical protein
MVLGQKTNMGIQASEIKTGKVKTIPGDEIFKEIQKKYYKWNKSMGVRSCFLHLSKSENEKRGRFYLLRKKNIFILRRHKGVISKKDSVTVNQIAL